MESGNKQEQPPRANGTVNPLWSMISDPLIFTMKITGFYHETSSKSATKIIQPEGSGWFPDPEPSRSRSWLNRLSQFYHALVCIYLWLNAIRITYALILNAMSGGFSPDQITLVVWYYNIATNNTIMFAMCYRENGMALFQRHWNSSATSLHARSTCSLLQATHNLKVDVDPKVPKRHNKFAVDAAITCSCFSLLNTVAFGYLTFGFGISPESSFSICGPWYSELICGINMIFPFFGSAAYVFPLALYLLICRSISAQFTNLSEEFDQVVNSPRPMDKTILNCFRRRHAIVCHTVEVADDIFSPFAAVMYSANIPCGIFLLYQLFYLGGEWFYVDVTLFWLFFCFSSVSVLSYFAVQVYEKAHSLRRRVHELQMDTFDSDLIQVQILFLARLDGPEIGMTALGCFVITKERVLAVISTLITFFTILLQFQGLSPSDDVTMATTNISMTTGVYTT